MALTDTAIRMAKPANKNYSLNDGDGLSLFVGANGAKHWYLRFSWHGGKQLRISFGTSRTSASNRPANCVTKRALWLRKGRSP